MFVVFFFLFSGLFKDFLIYFFIIFVHEAGHAITGILLGWKLKCISIYPFGGYTKFDEDINRPMKEEMLILLMGPLVQIITCGLILLLFPHLSFGSLFLQYNLSILLFNLLPIYPLDGGRMVNLFFNKFFPFLKSLNLSLFFSILLLSLLIGFSIHYKLLMNFIAVLCFLGVLIYKEYRNRKYYFTKFKLERFLKNYSFFRIKYIKKDKEMMRDKKHIFSFHNHYITEKEYLKNLFKNQKKS